MKHLEELNMNYFQHMIRSLSFCVVLLSAAATALVHAFFPQLFPKQTGDLVRYVNTKMG